MYSRFAAFGIGISTCLCGFYGSNFNKKVFALKPQYLPLELDFKIGSKHIQIYHTMVIAYDRQRRVPRWVCERFCPNSYDFTSGCMESPFRPDEELLPRFQTSPKDFNGTPYEPKHVAIPQNHANEQPAYDACNKHTNIVPISVNSIHAWHKVEKDLFKTINSGVFDEHGSVYMITGPVFAPKRGTSPSEVDNTYVRTPVIGKNNITVPTHFYKFIIGRGKKEESQQACSSDQIEKDAFLFRGFFWENVPDAQPVLVANVKEELERVSGLRFFYEIEKRLEPIYYLMEQPQD